MSDLASPALPRPIPDDDSEPFWAGCNDGRLMLQACPACGQLRYPPRPMCPRCNGLEVSWIEASGRGTVYSWIVPYHPVHPAVVNQVPYNVIIVELAEGPRMVSNLLETEPAEIVAGQPVEVVFERVSDRLTLPKFRRRA